MVKIFRQPGKTGKRMLSLVATECGRTEKPVDPTSRWRVKQAAYLRSKKRGHAKCEEILLKIYSRARKVTLQPLILKRNQTYTFVLKLRRLPSAFELTKAEKTANFMLRKNSPFSLDKKTVLCHHKYNYLEGDMKNRFIFTCLTIGMMHVGFSETFAMNNVEQMNAKSNTSNNTINYSAIDLIEEMNYDCYSDLIDNERQIQDVMQYDIDIDEIMLPTNLPVNMTQTENSDLFSNIVQLSEEHEPTELSEIMRNSSCVVHELTQDKTVIITAENIDTFQWSDDITSIIIEDGVTSIKWNAFSGCTKLTSVVIPDSVTEIGDFAFEGCTGLKSIIIPSSVTEIGEGAFYGCTGLTSIDLKNIKSINDSAFEGCSGLTSVNLEGVEEIGQYAFMGCVKLKDLNLKNVKSIYESAFEGCSGLTSINLEDVGVMGDYAFAYCTQLKDLSIKNMKSIEDYAFEGCCELTSVTIENVQKIRSGVFIGCTKLKDLTLKNVKSIGDCAFADCTQLKDLNLKNIESIESSAFKWCSGLISVNLEYVGAIGCEAFQGCTKLKDLNLKNVESIGSSAFRGCEGLTTMNLENIGNSKLIQSIESIGGLSATDEDIALGILGTFEDCFEDFIAEIIGASFANAYTNTHCAIGEDAFKGCTGLSTINLKNVASIDDSAFDKCYGLTSINWQGFFPINRPPLGKNVRLAKLNLESINGIIDNESFSYNTNLGNVCLGNSVHAILPEAFKECKNLENVYISNGVSCIMEDAFKGCHKAKFFVPYQSMKNYLCSMHGVSEDRIEVSSDLITTPDNAWMWPEDGKIVVPNGITDIGVLDLMFAYISNVGCFAFRNDIKSVTLSDSIKTIGVSTFCGCENLEEITIPSNIEWIGEDAFHGCDNLKRINIRCTDRVISQEDGSRFFDVFDYHIRVGLPEDVQFRFVYDNKNDIQHTDQYIDKSTIVTAENIDTFQGRDDITSIIIADGVTSIGEKAFFDCRELTSITIPNSINSISHDAFNGCDNLKKINIQCADKVVSLEDLDRLYILLRDCNLNLDELKINFIFANGTEIQYIDE